MNFIKWTFFIGFFAFAKNAPTTEKPFMKNNSFANGINGIIREMEDPKSELFNTEFQKNKLKFITIQPSVMTVKPSEDYRKIEMEYLASLEVTPQGFGHSIEIETFPVDFILRQFPHNTSTTAEYREGDESRMKLKLPTDHQSKPNEENEIKQKAKKPVKIVFDFLVQLIKEEISTIESQFSHLSERLKNSFERRIISIPNISGANYFLNNVTIHVLGGIQKLAVYWNGTKVNSVEVTTNPVRGTLVLNFHSEATTPTDLSFKSDSLLIARNLNTGEASIRAERYSFVNVKSNTALSKNESKSVMGKIESALKSKLLQ